MIFPYLINFTKQTSSIRNIYINVPTVNRDNLNKYVNDTESVEQEHRRLLYGWNEETGNQLHKYLPPDFDQYTKKINNFIRKRQKEYYVAIIDDGLITNKVL